MGLWHVFAPIACLLQLYTLLFYPFDFEIPVDGTQDEPDAVPVRPDQPEIKVVINDSPRKLKQFRLNEADFTEVCRMIDAEEEPEQGDPLNHEFWQILKRYENWKNLNL